MNKKKLIGCGLLLTSSMLMMPSVKAEESIIVRPAGTYITFNTGDGKQYCFWGESESNCIDSDGNVLIDEQGNLPVLSKDGYNFDGWYQLDFYRKINNFSDITGYMITDNSKYATIDAKWTKINEITKSDSNVNVTITTTASDVDVTVSNVVENTDAYTNISTLLKTSSFQAFNIAITSQNVEITPDGKITVTVDVPEGYDSSSVTIYGIDDNNTVTKLESTIENEKITFTSNYSYSYYAISSQSIETIVSTEKETIIETIVEEVEEANPDTGDNMKYVIGGTGIVMLLIGFVTSKLLKKRNS